MNEDNIELSLESLEQSIKKIVRRLDEMQKSVDLLFKDREILEDIQASIQSLKQVQMTSRTHHDNMTEDLKREVKVVGMNIEDKVDTALKSKLVRVKQQGIFKKMFRRKENKT